MNPRDLQEFSDLEHDTVWCASEITLNAVLERMIQMIVSGAIALSPPRSTLTRLEYTLQGIATGFYQRRRGEIVEHRPETVNNAKTLIRMFEEKRVQS